MRNCEIDKIDKIDENACKFYLYDYIYLATTQCWVSFYNLHYSLHYYFLHATATASRERWWMEKEKYRPIYFQKEMPARTNPHEPAQIRYLFLKK